MATNTVSPEVSFESSRGNVDCTVCRDPVGEYLVHGEPDLHPVCKECFDNLARQAGPLCCPSCRGRVTSIQGESIEVFQDRKKGEALCEAVRTGNMELVVDLLSGGDAHGLAKLLMVHQLIESLTRDIRLSVEIPEEDFPNRYRNSEKLTEALFIHLDKLGRSVNIQSLSRSDGSILHLLCLSKGLAGRILFNCRYPSDSQDHLRQLIADPRFAEISPEDLRRAFDLAREYNGSVARILADSSRGGELPGLGRYWARYSNEILLLLLAVMVAQVAMIYNQSGEII